MAERSLHAFLGVRNGLNPLWSRDNGFGLDSGNIFGIGPGQPAVLVLERDKNSGFSELLLEALVLGLGAVHDVEVHGLAHLDLLLGPFLDVGGELVPVAVDHVNGGLRGRVRAEGAARKIYFEDAQISREAFYVHQQMRFLRRLYNSVRKVILVGPPRIAIRKHFSNSNPLCPSCCQMNPPTFPFPTSHKRVDEPHRLASRFLG